MGNQNVNHKLGPKEWVIRKEDLIQRQFIWLVFWTMSFLVAGIFLGVQSGSGLDMEMSKLTNAKVSTAQTGRRH